MKNSFRIGRSVTVAAGSCVAGLLVQGAAAQSFDFQLKPEQGTLDADIQLTAPVTGSFIGDYDPVTNPGGTQTRLELFGSGNHPVPYTATLEGDTGASGIATQPTGQFSMDIDILGEQIFVEGFAIDALGGAMPGVDATLIINYQTFYTTNPNDIVPGGFEIPVDLGQVTVSALTMTQSGGAATGTLTPLGGNQYAVSVPVNVQVQLQAQFNGEPISPGIIELTLVLAGTLTIDGQTAQLALDLAVSLDEAQDGPLESFENIPFSIPGPFSGQPINLLLSGTVQSVALALDVEAVLVANGIGTVPPCPPIPGDLNCSGTVGVPDLLLLLAAWGNCGDCEDCAADLDGNCTVGVPDLLELLANWG